VIGSLDLYQWYNDVRNGNQQALRSVAIHLQNEDHTAIVQSWRLLRTRVVKLRWGPLNARSKEVAVEFVELACERVELE
jgi:phage tail-like protein